MYSTVDINLEDLIDYKCGTLIPWAIPMYNGCKWTLINVKLLCKCDGKNNGGASNEVIDALVNGNKELKEKATQLEETIKTLSSKITELSDSKEKWIEVTFNNQEEVTVQDSFITNRTVVDYTYLGGDVDFNPVTAVSDGSITVTVDRPISGVFLLQLSKES